MKEPKERLRDILETSPSLQRQRIEAATLNSAIAAIHAVINSCAYVGFVFS